MPKRRKPSADGKAVLSQSSHETSSIRKKKKKRGKKDSRVK